MIKNWLPIVTVMIMGIFILTACSDKQQPTYQNNENTETAKQEISLPDWELKQGSKGDNVTSLQKALVKIGYDIDTTGTFDDDTVWAIKDFQAQQVKLAATGVYDASTKQWLKKALNGSFKVTPGKGITKDEMVVSENETITVSNPNAQLVLVNKQHALPATYVPDDLIIPDVPFPYTGDLEKKYMRKEAANALEELFAAAEKSGLDLYAQSGYRSYERQQNLFASYAAQHGEKAANKFSAKPGESEHQTGLTMDVTSPDVDFRLTTDFGQTDEGKWLKNNAHKYGFIIRYPKGKEDITEYQYEPWHIRYVGKDAATVIFEQQITLEEYLGITKV